MKKTRFTEAQIVGVLRQMEGGVDLLHFRSGFLRAMLAIEETGYGTQT